MSAHRDAVVDESRDPGVHSRHDDDRDVTGLGDPGREDAGHRAELLADDLHFTFPPRPGSPSGHRVLDGISLRVRSGERIGLVGRSGCGKSTLLRILLGLAAPDAGAVRFNGTAIRPGSLRSLRDYRRHVQLIPQDPAASLIPRLTAERNVLVPLVRLQAPEPRLEIARWALERVGLDERFWRRRPHELSGGQAQRVAVARALALRPALVLADEPVSGLDHELRDQVLDLLHELSLDGDALGSRGRPGMTEPAPGGMDGVPVTTDAAPRSRVEPGMTEGAPGMTEGASSMAEGASGRTASGPGAPRGLGVLFVSHDPEAVARLCDRTLLLADGRLTESSALVTH